MEDAVLICLLVVLSPLLFQTVTSSLVQLEGDDDVGTEGDDVLPAWVRRVRALPRDYYADVTEEDLARMPLCLVYKSARTFM